jgi:hypothetical protein
MNDESGTGLVRYDAMCRAIAQAHEVDEVKDIRDKALALETYARQAKNIDAEWRACEIRLRAERKAGQLSKRLERAQGARTDLELSPAVGRSPTKQDQLTAAGVSMRQTERWEKLAEVPEEQFEAALAGPDKPTTNGIIAASEKPTKRDERALWLWGRLQDFERDGLLDLDPNQLFEMISDHMKVTTLRLAPRVAAWLGRLR